MSASTTPKNRMITIELQHQIDAMSRALKFFERVAERTEDLQIRGEMELDIDILKTLHAQLVHEGVVWGVRH